MVRFAAVAAGVLALAVGVAQAGKFNKAMSIGDAAPAFSQLEGVDGKKHGLNDSKSDVLVVVVTCNHCPVAVAYEDRIIAFTKKYQGKGVDVVAINVNNNDQDKLDKMKERSKEKGFNFKYLYDPSQKIGSQLGARVTPEFYVFDKNRKLVYTGAMDDNMNASKATKHYLADAVDAVLAGKTPAVQETQARGCGVQYQR